MAVKPLPEIDVLRQSLRYEATSGRLYWLYRPESSRSWNSRWSGKEAFTALSRGYRYGSVNGELYLAHRLIWKLVTGQEPDTIDHINGNRQDNRFDNLRSVVHRENCRNQPIPAHNTSGALGVVWLKAAKRWRAQIAIPGEKNKHLGVFARFEDAVLARKEAEKHYGFHKNHGRACDDAPVSVERDA